MDITLISCLTSNCGIGRYTEQLANSIFTQNQNIKLYRKNAGNKDYIHSFKYRSFRNLKHLVAPYYLKNAISKVESQVWHADNIDAFAALTWADKKSDSIKIVSVLDAIPLMYPHINWWDTRAFKYQLKQVAKKADTIITVSQTSKKDLAEKAGLNPEKIEVVYNGINHELLYPQKKKIQHKRFNISYIGGLGAVHKNAVALIETAKELKERGFDFDLEIGSGVAQYTELPALTKKYQLENHIHFKGFIPDAQLQSFLSEADVLLYASIFVGFCFPPLEAMICCNAVVSSITVSLNEILLKGALLTSPNASDFADAIISIASNNQLKSKLEKEAIAHAKTFSWEKTAEKMLKIYRA